MAQGQDPQPGTEAWRRERRYEARRRELIARPLLPVRHHAPITAPNDGDVRVCASVGPAGEVTAVWSAAKDLPALTTFPDPSPPRAVTARMSVHAPHTVSVTEITRLGLTNFVQPLPGGNILLAGYRSRRHGMAPDRNAVIYDAGGHARAAEVLGDGIQYVLADSTGHVWVGYADDGTFRDYGWGHPDLPPAEECVLIRFAPDLTPAWRYPFADHPSGSIHGCATLNVDGAAAWTTFDYDDPSLVRIDQGIPTAWRNEIGATALAVDGSRAALYNPHNYDRLAVGLLQGSHFQVTGIYRLVLPGQAALPKHTQVIGRGPCLHFLTGDDWYQLTMSDLPPQPHR